MSAFRPVCLLCQVRRTTTTQKAFPLSISQWQHHRQQQGLRLASTVRILRRRKPSRMVLSTEVDQPTRRYGEKRNSAPRLKNSPFGGMNQTSAKLRERPMPRSQAERHRASSYKGKGSEKMEDEEPLFKALKMQETLVTIPYERRNALKSTIGNLVAFDQFKLLPEVREAIKTALPGLEELSPTPIQRMCLRELLKRHPPPKKKQQEGEVDEDLIPKFDQYLIAAETGSGKTLGYLLPVIDAIKRADIQEQKDNEVKQVLKQQLEKVKKEDSSKQNPYHVDPPEVNTPETASVARPKAIILVPTAELVEQVGGVLKSLSHTVKFRSALLSASYTPRKIRNTLLKPGGLDIMVTTPQLLANIAEADPYILCRVTHLVADEADSLLDKSFSPYTMKIVEKTAPTLKKLLLCSATIPISLDMYLREHFPQMLRLVTPNLHAIPRRVQLGVIDVDKPPYRGNRNMACADAIWSLGKAGTKDDDTIVKLAGTRQTKNIIVFVNKRETAEELAQYLVSKGIKAVPLSRDIPHRAQAEIIAEFTTPRAIPSQEEIEAAKRNKKKFWSDAIPFEAQPKDESESVRCLEDTNVLVVTDLISRGVDTVTVKNVILYDVPHTSIDFIHRLGRVGRMNRRGRGIVLVGNKDRRDIVKGFARLCSEARL